MGGCGLLRVVWQLFRERLSEKLCTRQSRKAWQGVMGCRYTYRSLYSSLSYVYGGPQLSQQNQKCHGKTKNLTAKTKTSRQNQKPHGKNKIPHGKTKNLTAKTKYLTAKPKDLTAKPNTSSKNKIALVLPCVFAFAVRYLVFAVKYLVLPWGLWFFREGFGFVVRYFVFAVRTVRFSVLPWGFWFCHEVFCFCRKVFGFAVTVVGHRILYVRLLF